MTKTVPEILSRAPGSRGRAPFRWTVKAGLGTITLVVALLIVFGIEVVTHSVGDEASLLKLIPSR
jgi:hypothetical protein